LLHLQWKRVGIGSLLFYFPFSSFNLRIWGIKWKHFTVNNFAWFTKLKQGSNAHVYPAQERKFKIVTKSLWFSPVISRIPMIGQREPMGLLSKSFTYTSGWNSGVASTKFWGGPKRLILGEQQYCCLGRCFSKHKMTRYAKSLEGMAPWAPLATPTAKSTTFWEIIFHRIYIAKLVYFYGAFTVQQK